MDMATTPNTKPVPTPALTVSLIREALNPTPVVSNLTHQHREHGYLDAMLDAFFADLSDYKDGIIDLYDFRYVVYQAVNYYGCEWHTIEWDEAGVEYLETLVDQLVAENPSVWSDGFSYHR